MHFNPSKFFLKNSENPITLSALGAYKYVVNK